jgi:nucleoside-diphosphate-sugar epimerase
MRVFVTGAAGFVGNLFCVAAARSGHEVTATDRRRIPAIEGCERYVIKDMATISVDDLQPGTDAVVHLATGKKTYLPEDTRDAAKYQRVLDETVDGARRLFNVAASAGTRRFVYVSSMTVYPGPVPDEPTAGVVALDPHPERRGIYAHSKILAESAVQDLARSQQAMEVCILRFALVCGPGMGHTNADAADRDIVLRSTLVSTGKPLPLGLAVGIGHPDQTAPLLDVRDLLRGILALIAREPESGAVRTWDLQSGRAPLKRDLLHAYAAASGRRSVQVWLPPALALAGARLVEGLFRLRGQRPHLPYRIARAYRFDPERLPLEDFWRDVGLDPLGSMQSCLTVATTHGVPDIAPAQASAG